MKMFLFCWLATSLATTQAATLLGDTVLVRRELPSRNFLTGPFPVTVIAGPADSVSLSSGNNHYVNVESGSIFVGFGPQGASGGGFADHRIVISDIDWFGQPEMIIGSVSATSDLAGFQSSMVTFDAHSVSLWHGALNWTGEQYVDIQLTPALVPEPVPELRILPNGSAQYRISWSTNYTGWVLQSSLTPMAMSWDTVTNVPAILGNEFSVDFDKTEMQRFFRLKMQ